MVTSLAIGLVSFQLAMVSIVADRNWVAYAAVFNFVYSFNCIETMISSLFLTVYSILLFVMLLCSIHISMA